MQCLLHSVFCILFFYILYSEFYFTYFVFSNLYSWLYSVFRYQFHICCILFYFVFYTLRSAFLIVYSVFSASVYAVLKEYEKAAVKGIIWTNWGQDFNNFSTFSLPSLLIIIERKKSIYRCCLYFTLCQSHTVDEAMGANDPRIH